MGQDTAIVEIKANDGKPIENDLIYGEIHGLKKDENGAIIYDDDFFGKQASLTVSGQLEGELAATALGAIYTFGPTFRAENSNTPRHLAEFWMVEPEVAFADLTDLMDLEEEFIKFCVK